MPLPLVEKTVSSVRRRSTSRKAQATAMAMYKARRQVRTTANEMRTASRLRMACRWSS